MINMSLYDIVLEELKNDVTSYIHLMEHDKVRIAEKISQAVERYDNVNLLEMCANLRDVNQLQHRTIGEFAQFVDSVIHDKDDIWTKYQFDWNNNKAIRIWIQKFYDYCKEQYKY